MLQRFTQVGEFYVIDPTNKAYNSQNQVDVSAGPDGRENPTGAAIMIYDEVRDLVSIPGPMCSAMLRLYYSPRSPRVRWID
jgi:hypothetical protein